MKKRWLDRNVIGFCSASFFGDWCHEMSTAILPMFVTQLIGPAYAPIALGTIQGASDAIATITKLLSGWLADRVPFYKPFLVVGYGAVGVFLALIGTAQSVITILVYKTIAWFGRGLRGPMRDTWMAEIVPAQYYGRAFGLQRAWDTLGALLGPIVTFILLKNNYSLSSIFLVSFFPGMLAALSIALLTREEKRERHAYQDVSFSEQLKKMPSDYIFFLIIIFIFGLGNFNQTLLIYRVQEVFGQGHLSLVATMQGASLYVFFNIIRAISEFGMGTLSDYINRKVLLAIFGFGCFGLTAVGCIVQTPSLLLWAMLFGCAGLSAGTVKVLKKAHASYILPEPIRGTGLGLLQSLEGIGNLFSSFVVGVLWSTVGVQAALSYAAILSFGSMVLLFYNR